MRLLPILLLMLTSISLFAQNTTKDVFTSPRLTWFGLDFTKVKLINGADIPVVEDVKTRYAPAWNRLFIEEAKKYDLPRFFSKSLVGKDIKSVRDLNKTINVDELISYESYSISKDEVAEMVKLYESKSEAGIGLVFIVESLDKDSNLATVNVTFFDIKSRDVLYQQKMEGSPRGFGIRNYWAGAFLKILEQCKKNWKKWGKQI